MDRTLITLSPVERHVLRAFRHAWSKALTSSAPRLTTLAIKLQIFLTKVGELYYLTRLRRLGRPCD